MRNIPPPLAGLVPLILLGAIAGSATWGFSYDDAFITYRYAQHWAEGQGLVFNPGERVYGTSAPGWALLLGSLARIGTPLTIPEWGTLLSVLGLVVFGASFAPALARLSGGSRTYFMALVAVLVFTLRWNLEMFGAEGYGVLGLLGASAYLALYPQRLALAGVLAGLAMVIRLDAGLAVAVIGLSAWCYRRRFPMAFALAGAGPLIGFLFYVHGWFGTLWPNTLAGKQGELAQAAQSYQGAEWAWLVQSMGRPAAVVFVLWGALGGGTLLRRWKQKESAARSPDVFLVGGLMVWLGLHELFYHAIGIPFAPWYHLAQLNATALLAVLGAWTLAGRMGARRALALLFLLPVLLPSSAFLWTTWGEPPDPRFPIYKAIGQRLAREEDPHGEVASMEIGLVGYVAQRPVLDLVGLTNPEVLAQQRQGTLAAWVAARSPRYLIYAPNFGPRLLDEIMAQPDFASRYTELAKYSHPAYHGGTIRLLKKLPEANQP